MFKRLQHIVMAAILMLLAFNAGAQLAMPDYVCPGATKHYNVDPNPVPGSTYTWKINGEIQVTSISNTIDITWQNPGTYLLEVQELTADGCLGPVRNGQVFVSAILSIPEASVTQPTCVVAVGTITVTSPPPAVGVSFTITGTNPFLAAITNTTGVFEGLTAGVYDVTTSDAAGCVSTAIALTVNPVPVPPVAPTASVTVQPDCSVATGTIAVTTPVGPTYEYSIDGTVYQSDLTFAGLAPKTYSVTVRDSNSPTCVSTAIALTVNPVPEAPAAPVVGIITQPTCTTATGSVVLSGLPAGNWTINPGAITGSTSSTTVSGFGAGTYYFTVTNAAGCSSAASANVVINAAPVPPATPTASVTVQPDCSVATGTIVVTAPVGPTYEYSIDGTVYQSALTFAGLAPKTYSLTVRDSNSPTCVSTAITLTVNPIPEAPAAPEVGIITQPTCTTATGSVVLSGLPVGSWTINPGAITGSTSSTTVSGFGAGTYNFTVTNDAGCTSAASADVVINAAPVPPAPPTASVTVQPDCSFATGTIVVTAPVGSTDEYSIDGTVYQSDLTFAGLAPKTYSVTVRDSNNPTCVSTAIALTVNPVPVPPAPPTASVTVQPDCSVATGTIVVTAPVGPTYEYSIDGTVYQSALTFAGLAPKTYSVTVRDSNSPTCVSTAIALTVNPDPVLPAAPTASVTVQPDCSVATGTIVITAPVGPTYEYSIDGTVYQSALTFAGLAPKTYSVTVRDSNSPTCVSTAISLTVNPIPEAPAAPVVGIITQSTCTTATGSVVLSGLPAGNWTINPGAITGSTSSTTVSGLGAGTYNFTVTNAAGCTSATSADVVINAAPVPPAQPTASVTVQPDCSVATGTIVVTEPVGPTYEYSIEGTVYQSALTFAGLAPKTYSVTVRDSNSPTCVSTAISLTVNPIPEAPAAPVVGIITQPTCTAATGNVVLSGLPPGNWTINPGAITGSTSSTTVSGLGAGTYNFTVTNAAGCTSATSADAVINAAPVPPAPPTASVTVQPDCSVATGTIVVTAPVGPTYEYSIDGTVYQSALTFAGLAPKTYSVTVRDSNSPTCVSTAITLTVNPVPEAPAAPEVGIITQPTCTTATGSVVLSGLPAGNWTINPGAITGSTSSTTVSGLGAGTYNFTVTNAAGCTSATSADAVINAAPVPPAAPTASVTVQPDCSVATGTIVVTAPVGPTYEYSIDGTVYQSALTFAGLDPKTYSLTVRDSNSPTCVSTAIALTVSTIPEAPAAPVVGIITQPTCTTATGSVVLSGLPVGSWTINPGAITGSTSSTTVSGLGAGTYNFTVTNAAGCSSAASANVVINAAPVPPAAPTASVTVQPDCSFATGTIVVTAPVGSTYEYSINGTVYQSALTFAGLAPKTYSVTVRDSNSPTCVSTAIALTVSTIPEAPAAPVVGIITQPTCTTATGSVVLSGLPTGNWTINPGAITGSTSSTTVSGLGAGTYNFTVTNAAGCTSATSADAVINAAPGQPAAPVVGIATQPTCTTATGSVVLSGLPTGNWTINPGAITGSTSSTTVSGLGAGTYNFTVTNDAGCTSATSANVVINPSPATPAAPLVGAITQPTCTTATGSVVLSGLPLNGTWIVTRNPGGMNTSGTGATVTISGLAPGTFTFTVTNSAGCASTPSGNVVMNPFIPVNPIFEEYGILCQDDPAPPLPTTSINGITGVWNPVRISTAASSVGTKNYTFTPDGVECAISKTIAITVKTLIKPIFTQINPICQNTPAPPLQTTSLNGITGTWNPEIINTSIVRPPTLVFTPTTGQCAENATMDVIINGKVDPVFAPIGPFCQGSNPPVLPAISINGITGTWHPDAITTANIGFTNYNFSPSGDQCAWVKGISIEINSVLITPTFDPITPICAGESNPLSAISKEGITGTWIPEFDNNITRTYTFKPDAGQCATNTPTGITVTVKSLVFPTFDPIAPICNGGASPLQRKSNEGIEGAWSPAFDNMTTKIYTFTPTTGQCATTTTTTVTVTNWKTPTFAPIAPICSGEPNPLPSISIEGIAGSWSPAYDRNVTKTYTFTPSDALCATTATATVTVKNRITPTFNPIAPICSGEPNPLPSISIEGIQGTWSPGFNNTATQTYTFNPTDGKCANTTTTTITVTNRLTPTFAPVTPICSGEANPLLTTSLEGIKGTWSPEFDNTTTASYTFTPTDWKCANTTIATVTVTNWLTPTFAPITPICSGEVNPLPTSSLEGIKGTWSPEFDNSTTASYTFTPIDGGCVNAASVTVPVRNRITPTFAPIAPICSGEANPLPTTSLEGIKGTWSPEFDNTTTTGYTFTPAEGQCTNTATATVTVTRKAIPTFGTFSPLCENSPAPPLPSGSADTPAINGTWSPATITTTSPGITTYTFTPDVNQCAATNTTEIIVHPIKTSASQMVICSNQLPFIWNNNTYNTSGNYSVKLLSSKGCDSIATLNLTVVNAVTPTFVQLGPFLYNSVPPPLPEISINGVKGTWNPSAINTGSSGTTSYIFTPAITACAGTARMEIRTELQAIISADGKIPGVDGIIVGACGKVNLDASKSIGEALKYEWTLLDQGALLSGPSMISTEFRLSSSYTGNLPAAFRVGLLITDKAGNKDSEQITIHIDQPPVAGVYSSGKIEKDGSMIVDGTVSTGTKLSYKWTTAEGKIIGADNQPTAHYFGAGMYRLIITDIHGCQNVKDFKFPIELYEIFVNPDYVRISLAQDTTIKVLDNDRSTVRFINNSVRVIQQPRLGNTNVNSNGTITYSPTIKKPGHDTFVYEACDEVNLCDTAIVNIDIYESGITTPEGFSPNGDGVNDLFVFSGLQSYLNSTLYVYTRSGQLVYESHDYQNTWDGRTLKSTLSNLQLVPTGTYYYVLKLGVTNRVIKGFVYIAY